MKRKEVKRLTHIDFVVPNMSLEKVVHKAWALHEELFGGADEFSYTVDCEILPEMVYERHYDADVIVSRGGTASGLKQQNQLTPIVEIPITTTDMALSIRRAIREHGEKPIGVVGTKNMLSAVTHLQMKAPVPVTPYVIPSVSMADIREGVNRAKADGCRLIVAGHNTCGYARELGLEAGMIYSSVESIFLAITEAKRCAQVSWVEKGNSLMFRSIVDHVAEAIITVDRNDLIRTFNPQAERLLNRRAADCIGQSVRAVFQEGKLASALSGSRPLTNEIVRAGGVNFVLNCVPLSQEGLRLGMLITLQEAGAYSDVEGRLRERLRDRGYAAKYRFSGILGNSPEIRSAIRRAQRFARVDSNILLCGETGTGKELFAQSIHNDSDRAGGPFVAVNCATLPENLMESELFGYEAGAFTGASKQGKAGLFEAAHKGTIFLDEISEMPLHMQSRLLRVIQEREVRRVGGNRVVPIDVRIICATNQDLPKMIAEGKFREDLYYRLNVLSVTLPPMRERAGDASLIMKHYVAHYAAKFGKGEMMLSEGACRLAEQYPWPGNIRELRNVSEQLTVLCETQEITEADMEAALPVRRHAAPSADPAAEKPRAPLPGSLNDMERERIAQALAAARTRQEAAALLGISKATLWRKCRTYGLG